MTLEVNLVKYSEILQRDRQTKNVEVTLENCFILLYICNIAWPIASKQIIQICPTYCRVIVTKMSVCTKMRVHINELFTSDPSNDFLSSKTRTLTESESDNLLQACLMTFISLSPLLSCSLSPSLPLLVC